MDSSSSSWVTEGKPIKGVLLDISGVLRDGNSAIPGSLDAFHKLVQSGIQVRLVTNESQVTRKDSLDKLTRLGFQGLQFDKIFAPAPLLAEELVRQGHRPHLLVHPRVKPEFAIIPDLDSNEAATCVVIGDACEHFTYDGMNTAFRTLLDTQKRGLEPKLFTLGRGRFYSHDQLLWLDVGPFCAALEYSLNIKAELFGKPSKIFFDTAVASMASDGISRDEIVMIGDDIIGDVKGAMDAGMRGVLVRTGKFRAAVDENHVSVKPSGIVDDLRAAVDMILS